MATTIALAGDTMLGRLVAEQLDHTPSADLVAPEIAAAMRAADLCVLNLECCISGRGEPWPDSDKPFFFRAPPVAVELLAHLGVDAVTLANNHALDFGRQALHDTLDHLHDAGIATVGAGGSLEAARRPADLDVDGMRVRLIGVTDHPVDYAATPTSAGVAHAELGRGLPAWLTALVTGSGADLTLATPHWGPNMTPGPTPRVRTAAASLREAGVDLVAGHSAHVFHGADRPADGRGVVLYDLGDFLDDYAVDPVRRNDLGLLWLVTVEPGRVLGVEALPLHLGLAATAPARGADRAWIADRLTRACAPYGTDVEDVDGRLPLAPTS